MTQQVLVKEVYDSLQNIQMVDAHTHVDVEHLSARGLHDIILYHMQISELYSSGCPSGRRLSELPTDEEVEQRLIEAVPFYQHVENTSCSWGARIILKDLYNWDKPITSENWREIDLIIKEKYKDPNWSREILRRAGISKVSTELWRGHDQIADDIFTYSIEWAFFTRSQWGQYDTALLELENAWNQEVPGAPLPVTVDIATLDFKRKIYTLKDLDEAMSYYCKTIPYEKIDAIASHLSTDINYRRVTRQEMEKALANRSSAGEAERDIYSNYIFDCFLQEYSKLGCRAILQFSLGSEPLPFEGGSKIRVETLYQIAEVIEKYPNINFQFFIASAYMNQSLCTLAREFQNISVSGYWWHNFFPSNIRKVMEERLDMLPLNRQIGFFSDAYCVDWAYAKAVIVKQQLAQVLAQRIEQGQYTKESALRIADAILRNTPSDLLDIN